MDWIISANPRIIVLLWIFAAFLASCWQVEDREPTLPVPEIFTSTPTATYIASQPPTATTFKPQKTKALVTLESTPLPTQSPTQSLLINVANGEDEKLIKNDLLFLSKGKLLRWEHNLGMVTPAFMSLEAELSFDDSNYEVRLPGSVLKYILDERRNKIALWRAKGISANGVELFDLVTFDVNSGEVVVLLNETPRINQISMSPNGEWVTYTMQENAGKIFSLPTNGESQPNEIGDYVIEDGWEYSETVWSPDSRYLVWSDAGGVWITKINESHPRRVLTDSLEVEDFNGNKSTIRVMYTSLAWSPNGRFILTTVQPFHSTVRWQGIIDTSRGIIAEVPGSYEFLDPIASAIWMQNGSLFVVYGSNNENNQPPELKIWRVIPTRDGLVTLEENFAIKIDQADESRSELEVQPDYILDLPTQINSRILSFVVKSSEQDELPTLFKFDKKLGMMTEIGRIPSDVTWVNWSADGNSALLRRTHGSLLMILADNKKLIDLSTMLNSDACCATWVDPDFGERLDKILSE